MQTIKHQKAPQNSLKSLAFTHNLYYKCGVGKTNHNMHAAEQT